ncbi:Gag-Pol polyprotein [Labeo rohita]|uniref:Gag-Pol polyprotein n=1 Tax=Labeo rohita TaxID=84645 RepID=A0ABQ8LB99_LABRO|nr:Gag-Pol polyprotein [Labeo rohita]
MATIGHIDTFDEVFEQWTTYIERFEHFTNANDIEEEKRVLVLLSIMGTKTYSLLRNLIAPAKPEQKTYQEIVTTLTEHFSPKPLIIAERFRFHKHNQEEGETVAVEISVATETIARKAQQLSTSLKVNAIHVSSPKQRHNCKRCGKTNHTDEDCWYKDKNCHSCGKKGHIRHVCRTKRDFEKERKHEKKFKPYKRQNKSDKRRVHHLDAGEKQSGESSTDTEKEMSLYMITKREQLAHICITPEIEGKMIEMELDTGAAVLIISREKYANDL